MQSNYQKCLSNIFMAFKHETLKNSPCRDKI